MTTLTGYTVDWGARRGGHRMEWPIHGYFVVTAQLSVVSDSATTWTASCQASLSLTISQSLLKLMFTESVTPSNHLTLCHPLLLLPSVFPSITVFWASGSFPMSLWIRWALCIRRPKYQSFSFSISPSSEDSGLISVATSPVNSRTRI